jgi:outer membrane protein assembly factor BamD
MKIYNYIIAGIIILFLSGCASESNPLDEFKGQSAETIFNNAEKATTKKNYEDAIKGFEALDIMYPFGKYAQQAQLDVIYAYYKNRDMDSAIAAAGRYIHLYPAGPNTDYAYYMKGLASFDKSRSWADSIYKRDPSTRDLSSMKEAFADFNEVVTQYPNSKYASDAKNRMIYIRNLMAKYELSVADYYMRHKAYVAAANRANYIVTHLEGTPEVEEALKVMVSAYTALGDTEDATKAQQLLDLNFPKSSNSKKK